MVPRLAGTPARWADAPCGRVFKSVIEFVPEACLYIQNIEKPSAVFPRQPVEISCLLIQLGGVERKRRIVMHEAFALILTQERQAVVGAFENVCVERDRRAK